jgi:hypothetical protein
VGGLFVGGIGPLLEMRLRIAGAMVETRRSEPSRRPAFEIKRGWITKTAMEMAVGCVKALWLCQDRLLNIVLR